MTGLRHPSLLRHHGRLLTHDILCFFGVHLVVLDFQGIWWLIYKFLFKRVSSRDFAWFVFLVTSTHGQIFLIRGLELLLQGAIPGDAVRLDYEGHRLGLFAHWLHRWVLLRGLSSFSRISLLNVFLGNVWLGRIFTVQILHGQLALDVLAEVQV